jgi:hypothetical protein
MIQYREKTWRLLLLKDEVVASQESVVFLASSVLQKRGLGLIFKYFKNTTVLWDTEVLMLQ